MKYTAENLQVARYLSRSIGQTKQPVKKKYPSKKYNALVPLNPKAFSDYDDVLSLVPVAKSTLKNMINDGLFPTHSMEAGKRKKRYWSNKDLIKYLKDPEAWVRKNKKSEEV